MHNIISSSIEILQQGKTYLQTASPENYKQILKPCFISSCGEHMRHTIDHYVAIRDATGSGKVNYDKRQRGSEIEVSIDRAQGRIDDLIDWLSGLGDEALDQTLEVSTEICVSSKTVAVTNSTLARELLFVNSHAIHHYSVISIAAKMQQQEVDDSLGIAPATATFLRQQPCAR